MKDEIPKNVKNISLSMEIGHIISISLTDPSKQQDALYLHHLLSPLIPLCDTGPIYLYLASRACHLARCVTYRKIPRQTVAE